MEPILLQIPPEIAAQIKLPPKRAKKLLMEELVLRLYEEGIISSRHGASLLEMDRLSFENFLASHNIGIHGNTDDIIQDISSIDQVI